MMTKSQKLAMMFGGWVLFVLVALTMLGNPGVIYYFILCLLGFLIIFDLSGPYTIRPKWKSKVITLTILGIAIFAIIAIVTFAEVIGLKLF